MREATDDDEGPVAPSMPGAAFWALMDRWGLPDAAALRLIEAPAPPKSGTRPRFRLRGGQVETYEMLRGIDRHLEALFGASRDWLHTKLADKPFSKRTPLDALAEDGVAVVPAILRQLEREVFRSSLERSARSG